MVKDFGLGGEEILHSNLKRGLKGCLEGGLKGGWEGGLVGDLAQIFKDSDKHTFTVLQDYLNQGHLQKPPSPFLVYFSQFQACFFSLNCAKTSTEQASRLGRTRRQISGCQDFVQSQQILFNIT